MSQYREYLVDALSEIESRLGGEQRAIAARTLEAQFQIFVRQAAGEDTEADERHVRAITANLEHAARRVLEDVWMGVIGRIGKAVVSATLGT